MKDTKKTMFMITYTPQTIGGVPNHDKKHITRRGKWDNKCKFNETTFYTLIEIEEIIGKYRYATKKLAEISVGLNEEEMKVVN
jgi:hypothetical protein